MEKGTILAIAFVLMLALMFLILFAGGIKDWLYDKYNKSKTIGGDNNDEQSTRVSEVVSAVKPIELIA